jgi:hypothetical protein
MRHVGARADASERGGEALWRVDREVRGGGPGLRRLRDEVEKIKFRGLRLPK